MTNANVELVRSALDACRRGDTAALKEIFSYDNTVQIVGAFKWKEFYPLLDDYNLSYGKVEGQGDDTVVSEIRYEADSYKARGRLTDKIENVGNGRKIVSSTVVWEPETKPYQGATDDAPNAYAGTYGWWGWPFGRRRY